MFRDFKLIVYMFYSVVLWLIYFNLYLFNIELINYRLIEYMKLFDLIVNNVLYYFIVWNIIWFLLSYS